MNTYDEETRALDKTLEVISRHIKIEEKYYAIAEAFIDAIISTDGEGHIIFCNTAAKKMFGYGDEIIGKRITFLMPERYRDTYQTGINRYTTTGIPKIVGKTVELSGLKKDGTEFPIEISLSVWTDGEYYFTGIIRDITERKQIEHSLVEANKKLEELSIRDSLTNLFNRRYTDKVLEIEFNRAKRYSNSLSCLLIDIDYFKKINDLYGHSFGDKVLVYFSSFLLEMTRSTDIVTRYGGEEFLIILPDVNIHGAMDFAERLRDGISKRIIEDKETNISIAASISVGVSSFGEHTSDKDEIINQADKALYEAKRTGRNKVCCYTQTHQEQFA